MSSYTNPVVQGAGGLFDADLLDSISSAGFARAGLAVVVTGATGVQTPYATPALAKASAVSGDTIIVYPGSYTSKNLMKAGVNWIGLPGANIAAAGDGISGIFDDGGTAMTCQITWYGNLQLTSSVDPTTDAGLDNILHVSHASSVVQFRYNKMRYIDALGAGFGGAILHRGGTLDTYGNEIQSDCSGIYWTSGESRHHCNFISGAEGGIGGYPIWSTPGTAVGQGLTGTYTSGFLWVKGIQCRSQNINGVIATSGTLTARVWLTFDEITVVAPTASAMIDLSGNRVYLDIKKITAVGAITYPLAIGALGQVEVWGRIQKISSGTSGAIIYSTGSASSKSWLDVQHIEDTLTATVALVNCALGTHVLNGVNAIGSTAADGVLHSGGTLTISDSNIDISANNTAGDSPIKISAAGLTVNDTSLVCNAANTDAVTAGSALSVTLNQVRDVTGKGKHANVTVVNTATL